MKNQKIGKRWKETKYTYLIQIVQKFHSFLMSVTLQKIKKQDQKVRGKKEDERVGSRIRRNFSAN